MVCGVAGCDELGDAEVEQLRRPVGGHQDVAGLDVPVHDQVAVRELHRGADLAEQRARSGMDGDASRRT